MLGAKRGACAGRAVYAVYVWVVARTVGHLPDGARRADGLGVAESELRAVDEHRHLGRELENVRRREVGKVL